MHMTASGMHGTLHIVHSKQWPSTPKSTKAAAKYTEIYIIFYWYIKY